ncbi:hypothetical protein PLICRDRAFT_143089 [Plicaturopsis crispa FD-325 SS-3]|nr:hypothetical protein PLICRDRAFT_143089 [Plicaturopsis crispa FD-325 SS-3]
MAPLSQAVNTLYALSREDGTHVYRGQVDDEWTVGAVTHGGYALAMVLDACIKYQSPTKAKDPIHVTAHFLSSTSAKEPCEIHVRTLKTGRAFSNIVASLIQRGSTRISAHLIFGTLAPAPDDPGPHLTLQPPSGYARRIPIYSHPSDALPTEMNPVWTFKDHLQWGYDEETVRHNAPDGVRRTHAGTIGGGGVEWAAWLKLKDPGERITASSMAFFVDMFQNLPRLLPKEERGGIGPSWFPTMTLSLEFKFPIPRTPDFAARTVGLYSSGTFMNDPQGRHNAYVEVWTAPTELSEGKVLDGWRDKQRCLAVATQMALVVPAEVNAARARKDTAKL